MRNRFVALVGFTTRLEETLQVKDTVLPVSTQDMAYLRGKLGEDGYTYLRVKTAVAHEIVKVVDIQNCAVMIERAQEGTSAIVAKYDSCVGFEWTENALSAFIQQGMGGTTSSVLSISSGNDCLTVQNDNGNVKITKEEQEEVSWRSGNKEFTQNKCGVISEKVVASGALADGEYKNATLIVKDGHIIAIKAGTNIVYTGGGCCGCTGTAEQ